MSIDNNYEISPKTGSALAVQFPEHFDPDYCPDRTKAILVSLDVVANQTGKHVFKELLKLLPRDFKIHYVVQAVVAGNYTSDCYVIGASAEWEEQRVGDQFPRLKLVEKPEGLTLEELENEKPISDNQ